MKEIFLSQGLEKWMNIYCCSILSGHFFQVLVSAVNQDSEHTSLLNSPSSSGETTPIRRPLMVSEHLFKLSKEATAKIQQIS